MCLGEILLVPLVLIAIGIGYLVYEKIKSKSKYDLDPSNPPS